MRLLTTNVSAVASPGQTPATARKTARNLAPFETLHNKMIYPIQESNIEPQR